MRNYSIFRNEKEFRTSLGTFKLVSNGASWSVYLLEKDAFMHRFTIAKKSRETNQDLYERVRECYLNYED